MEDDDLALPADTLAILNQFLAEQQEREQNELELIENQAGKSAQFEEIWQLSQFWYNEHTKSTLGQVVIQLTKETQQTDDYRIALLSCPSLYATIKDVHSNVHIFEYDKRFAAFGKDFVYYDFNEADSTEYLKEHYSTYDLIIADPPFLSEECISKIAKLIRNMQRSDKSKIIFCSGEVVQTWLQKYLDLKKCNFRPGHERNLANEFVSYANFDLDRFINVQT